MPGISRTCGAWCSSQASATCAARRAEALRHAPAPPDPRSGAAPPRRPSRAGRTARTRARARRRPAADPRARGRAARTGSARTRSSASSSPRSSSARDTLLEPDQLELALRAQLAPSVARPASSVASSGVDQAQVDHRQPLRTQHSAGRPRPATRMLRGLRSPGTTPCDSSRLRADLGDDRAGRRGTGAARRGSARSRRRGRSSSRCRCGSTPASRARRRTASA